MMRFSANTGFLFKDLPFLERIHAAARAGFDAVEFHDEWRHEAPDDLRAALREAGLPLLGLNTCMEEGHGAAIAGQQGAAREDIEQAIEAARALEGRAVHVLAGKVEADEETLETYRANLAHAAERAAAARSAAAPDGLTVLVEPLSRAATPLHPVRTVDRAAKIVEEVGAPNLRIMFDLYHIHQEGDDIAAAFARHAARVGHVQIADPETRSEPRTEGPHAIGPLLRALRAAGYNGPFGCEYRPAIGVENGLAWREAVQGLGRFGAAEPRDGGPSGRIARP